MKIVKGVATYTLLIIGALAVFAMLLVGCMFMFPNFDVFGWKVIFNSNEKVLTYGSESDSYKITAGQEYTINIDAGMHNVYIHQFGKASPDPDYVYVEKIDDMFGLYTGDYNRSLIEPENPDAAAKKIINIKLAGINGAVMGRNSRLDVYLPKTASGYNFKIKTTTGSIHIDGAASKTENLNVTGLDIETTSGGFSWANVRTSAIHNGADANIYTGTKVSEIDTKDSDYKIENFERFVFLKTFKAKTVSGKLNFVLSSSDAITTSIAAVKAANVSMYDVLGGKYATDEAGKTAWLNALGTDEEAGFYIDVARGDVKFSRVIAPKFNVVGTDVLIEAKNITSLSQFYFNVPNGVFKVEELNSPLSTIATKNIDVNLKKSDGELAITTTYGNISIETVNANTSLASTHGNINIGQANAAISAISEYGDIVVGAYRGKGYLKNTRGKITASFDTAWYNEAKSSLNANKYTETFEVYNEDGSITLNNVVFETVVKNKGGNVNISYYEMVNTKNSDNIINHKLNLEGGNADIKVSTLEAFKFKGSGNVGGSISGTTFTATEGYVRIFVPNDASAEATLACLEVTSTNANATFSAYYPA